MYICAGFDFVRLVLDFGRARELTREGDGLSLGDRVRVDNEWKTEPVLWFEGGCRRRGSSARSKLVKTPQSVRSS